MRRIINRGRLLIVAGAAGLGALLAAFPATPITAGSDYFTRLGYDLLLPIARRLDMGEPLSGRVVLIAEDEITHNEPPFDVTPDTAWAPQLATVLNGVHAQDPAVVSFDMIFPKSIDTRDLLPGFEREMKIAMRRLANDDALILGYLDFGGQKIMPYRGQVSAAYGDQNLRSNYVAQDADAIMRVYPAGWRNKDTGETETTLAVESAIRAGATPPKDDFLIDFRSEPTFDVYSLVDIHACAKAGALEDLDLFKDKIVFLGTSLDVEDRHVAANRFVRNKVPETKTLPCATHEREFQETPRFTTPGVFLHMRAADQVLTNTYVDLLSPAWRAGLGALFVGGMSAVFLATPPVFGLLIVVSVAGAFYAGSLGFLARGLVAPWILWSAGVGLTYMVVEAYQAFVEGKEKRFIRNAFQHYLAPALVEQLADNPEALSLGGERRYAAIFFSDLAGFTTLSEQLADEPETLVQVTNMNLAMVADAIEENGGYVDKFIGDAVMAVWGAPVEVDNPETRAARAAVQAIEGLNDTNARLPKPGLPPVDMRIGLNAGTIIAGNMGSEKRLNYTIVGDAVNLAARLEPACKVYSIKIMAGEDLAVKLDDSIVSRCVDYVAVKGKSLPVRVYEIAGLTRTFPQDRLEVFREFQKGLEAFWDRRFQEALAIFESLKDHDTVAEMYVGRTQRFIEEPPPEDWDGSVAFMTK